MILTGPEIHRQYLLGRLVIEPFTPAQLNPNSYNFRLGSKLKIYTSTTLDVRHPNPVELLEIPDQGVVLQPGRIYLGSTIEIIGSDYYVPIIRARSGTARLGLFIHVTADLIDIGSVGQLTLQLHAVQPIRVYKELMIGQVTFWRVEGAITLYAGKYQGSRGPQESQIHRDFGDSMEVR
jgi:dCTP deaminase